MRVNASASLAERLTLRLKETPTCLLFEGRANSKGYGLIDTPRLPGQKGRPLLAHRVAWELVNGPIPDGIAVCHRCDVPACCLIAHLFLGTRADNNADMLAKGRYARGEAKHRKLTNDDVAEIRRLWETGGIMQKDIAAQFGVGRPVISEIIARKSWTHIT